MRFASFLAIVCITVSTGLAQPVDTVKVIYEVLAEKDNTTVYQKLTLMGKEWGSLKGDIISLQYRLLQYVDKHPDLQAEVFSVLLINTFRAEANKSEVNFNEIDRAITKAMLSNDKYIAANAYWMKARIYSYLGNFESMLVYYNAAFELFKKLPVSIHGYMDNICFDIAQGLYLRSDFRNSIEYGLKAYRLMDDEESIFKRWNKIFLLDLLGAAYKEIGQPDSSILIYTQILSELQDNGELYEDDHKLLWISIAEGKIGENYVTQGKLSEAEPLINKYYHVSIRSKDTLNILLAKNAYALLEFSKGKYDEAMTYWKEVFIALSPDAKNNQYLLEKVCKGMAIIYKNKHNADSAWYYLEQANAYRSEINENLFLWDMKTIKQEYEFMELTSSAHHMNERIVQLKNARNYIIVIILLLSTSVYLFMRKKRNKLKYEIITEKLKNDLMDEELGRTQERIASLKNNLMDRNEMAQHLRLQIQELEHSKDAGHLISEINDYILTTPEGWAKFKSSFLRIHPHFLNQLEERSPSLSPAELRLCMMLYLKLNNTEIAGLLGISSASVSKSKFRLKQKLDLDSSYSLNDFMESL